MFTSSKQISPVLIKFVVIVYSKTVQAIFSTIHVTTCYETQFEPVSALN